MCGIVGVFGKLPSEDLFSRSLDTIKHRGPDDRGVFYDEKNNVALGHSRLSIIDLSNAGHQPFFTKDRKYAVVFNGEIYNYLELRDELKNDHSFQTNTDTEVLIAAYIKWGKDCLSKFNGMFAFVIWDDIKKELFCARDRLGIKPFFYYEDKESFYFASEIKALLELDIPREENDEMIFDYLYYGFYDHTNKTFFKNVNKLQAGHCMVIGDKGKDIVKYWDLDRPKYDYAQMTDKDIQEEFVKLLTDSIKLRFRSDVSVGLNLSSGLDSNSLYYLAEHALGIKGLNIFSMSLPSKEYDECVLIDGYLSKEQKKYWHISLLKPDEIFDLAQKMNVIQDQPYGGIPTIAYDGLNDAAKKADVTVLLEGQGVDEILAGYKYYQLELKKDLDKQNKSSDIFSFDYSQDMTKLIDTDILDKNFIVNYKKVLKFDEKFESHLLNAQYRDIMFAKLPRVLRFNDHVSMNYGLELRVPYLDHRIVEFCFWLPSEYKINRNVQKKLLRDVMADKMPDVVNNKNKKAFGAVQTEWFRKYFKEDIYCIIHSRSFKNRKYWNNRLLTGKINQFFEGSGDNSFFIWQCINLEFWFREFIDQ